MSLKWHEFKVSVTPALKEIIIEKLFELGAEAVNENVDTPNVVQAYFPAEKSSEAEKKIYEVWGDYQSLYGKVPDLFLRITEVPDDNWSESYKKYYYAQFLTDLFFLRPKWDIETPIPKGTIPIIMDPGQAFGTGLHPSTRLCLRTLQSQILDNSRRDQIQCIDVGTGSGILALAAFHLGVKKVVAIDNDPIAVQVAKENFELNNVDSIEVSDIALSNIKGSYEFIISNILLETHRVLASEYSRLIAPGGLLLLSGLLGYQRQEVLEIMRSNDFVNIESRNYQEWASFLFVKRKQ